MADSAIADSAIADSAIADSAIADSAIADSAKSVKRRVLAQPRGSRTVRGTSPQHPRGQGLAGDIRVHMAGRRTDFDLRQAIHSHCVDDAGIVSQHRTTADHVYVRTWKPLLDICCAAVLLAWTIPLFLVIAVAIRNDSPGPIFFRQDRTGYLGRRFRMFKFRTMVRDAEQLKSNILHLNIHAPHSPDFKVKEDPRITRIGRILRKTSLDELPNLINVLRGEMSLVGPRPTSFSARTYREHHLCRLGAKPGITGLWQVYGRADVDFDERTQLDLRYIGGASLWLDMKLILMTPLRACKGAY